MDKKFSAPLERTARLLDLVPYINSHQGISLKELSEVFEVTQPQMINDLTTLWMCGLPGYTPLELMDLDFESGYVTINNAQTLSKPRSITFDEGVALVLGLDLLRSSISSERLDLVEKIDSLSQRLSTLINVPASLSAEAIVNSDIAHAVTNAIRIRSALEITYHSLYRDETSNRQILPIELIEQGGHQYLISYCYTAGDFREFRLDRIHNAQPIEISQEITQTTKNQTTFNSTIKVLEASRELAERFNLSEITAGMEFDFGSYSQQWLQRAVLSSGRRAVLITPQEMRQSVAEIAQSMLDRYKPS